MKTEVILRLKAAASAKGETGLTLTRGSCVNQAGGKVAQTYSLSSLAN